MVGLDKDRQLFDSRILWQFTSGVSNGPHVFNGAYYTLTGMKTFAGMCMSPIISETSRKTILGVHIGGVTGTARGCGMAILETDLTFAIERLYQKSKTFVRGPQASEIPDEVAGIKIAKNSSVHPKSPVNWLEEDAAVEVYGSIHNPNHGYKSAVIQTPISPIVEEVCGVPNLHGPPKFEDPIVREDGHVDKQTWKPWYASIATCSQPSIGFDAKNVEWAMNDYLMELKDDFDKQKCIWERDMRPLSRVEIVSGIDGKRFIDSMNSSTSMGFPICGPKNRFLVDLDPTDQNAAPRTFVPEIWDMVDALDLKASKGESLNQIFGASLKDEPTKLIKNGVPNEKVRVFQAAPIALQILIRKYFLPIARFLSINPLTSECAVGINSHGDEWHELSEHMAKFGNDRVIAGDYAKYDLRMPEQLTLSAFAVMIEIATWSGNYTKADIKIMEVIAHEVCSPLVAYNGTLVRFMGTNPSGQNMTVYLNSIVNSLLHRLAFSDCYSPGQLHGIGQDLGLDRPATFRDLCAISTYGDDAKGSVRKGYDRFNHVTMAQYLARNDIVFTMPDKTSDPVPFMSRFDADFLKRKDLFNPELGVYVGALDEGSIFKSLHSILESKVVSPETVSAMNLAGAMREWFFHGEEKYEMRREQMKEIASKANLPVPDLDITYSQRVNEWKDKYEVQSGTLTPSQREKTYKWILGLQNPEKTLKTLEKANLTGKRALKVQMLRDHLDIDDDSSGFSVSSEWSTETEPLYREEVEAVAEEDTLIDRTKAILGIPTCENIVMGAQFLGEIDLLYLDSQVALVIECKRVVGRAAEHAEHVKKQAIKYAGVIALLRPDLTVYGITCTEMGYMLEECIGEPRFPRRFADFLDKVPISK